MMGKYTSCLLLVAPQFKFIASDFQLTKFGSCKILKTCIYFDGSFENKAYAISSLFSVGFFDCFLEKESSSKQVSYHYIFVFSGSHQLFFGIIINLLT